MRLNLSGDRTVELGYCYNVLPGESVDALVDQIARFCRPVRERLGIGRLGVGLWIARDAATELGDPAALGRLRAALTDGGLYCFTLNGFPYGGFHAPRVKERVFEPSWADAARVDYTLDLAAILGELLPDDVATGSISTVPLGARGVDREAAAAGLGRAAEGLAALAARTGRRVELAVEPEPGSACERIAQLADAIAAVDPRLVGACLDCCHAAVVGEDPAAALGALAAAGRRCVKIQISSALVVPDPASDAAREQLAAFDEPRFLHQVHAAGGGAALDIPDALASLDRGTPWRVHFHVPVHRADVGAFATTRDAIAPALAAALAAEGAPPHLEVETYTWSVLPAGERPTDDAGLVEGIARELAWARDLLVSLGATPA